jgi:hypothetical protein
MNFRVYDVSAPLCSSKIIPNATQTNAGVIKLRNHLAGSYLFPEIAKPPSTMYKLDLLGFIEDTKELALTSFSSGRNELQIFNFEKAKTFKPAYTSGVGNISMYVIGHGGNNKLEKDSEVSVTLRGITYTLTAKHGKFEPPTSDAGGAGGDAILTFDNSDTSKNTIIASGGVGGESATNGLFETFSNDDVHVFLGGGGGGHINGGGCSYLGGGCSTKNSPGMFLGAWGGIGCWENNSTSIGFGGGIGAFRVGETKSFGGGGGGCIFALFKNVPADAVFNMSIPPNVNSGGQAVIVVDY